MSHHQKNDAGFPTGGNSPKFTEDDERRVVHSVISAFVASSPHGLGASKYAPKNYVPPNWLKTKQAQQNKEKELQKAGPFTNTAKPPVNTENTKYAAADFDDTSAFLAAMNRNTTPANRNTVTANATSEISESKPKPALSTTSESIQRINSHLPPLPSSFFLLASSLPSSLYITLSLRLLYIPLHIFIRPTTF